MRSKALGSLPNKDFFRTERRDSVTLTRSEINTSVDID